MKYAAAIILAFLLILGGLAGSVTDLSGNAPESIENHRTATAPLESRFPALGKIEACYWQADVFGTGRFAFGPTPYWMKGFVVIQEAQFETMTEGLDWTPVEMTFDREMNPTITGKESLDWYENESFTRAILGNGFMGKVCCDMENRMIYFEVENL
jgi:hypothetical protein